MPISYISDAPPPSMETMGVEPPKHLIDILMRIEVIEVLDLNEVDSSMLLRYQMTLSWRDSRVKFKNLKQDVFLNTVGREDASKVWYPRVVFYNTRETEETTVIYYGFS